MSDETDEQPDEARELLVELLDNGCFFPSAIELEPGFDGLEYFRRVVRVVEVEEHDG